MRNTILAQADKFNLAAAACDAVESDPDDVHPESDPDDMSQRPTTVIQNHILRNHLQSARPGDVPDHV